LENRFGVLAFGSKTLLKRIIGGLIPKLGSQTFDGLNLVKG
jgi:hypothetical protein